MLLDFMMRTGLVGQAALAAPELGVWAQTKSANIAPERGSTWAIAWRVMRCFITAYSPSTFL